MTGQRTTPTLASIAERVGVSVNTVSRALRAPHTVRAELRRKINSAMEDLNYVPNRLAGGLSGTRSDIVAVVVTSLHYSEFAGLIDALQSALLKHDLQVMLANTRYDPQQEISLVRSLLSWRPAAVAIIGVDHPPKVAELFAAAGMPVIEMWDIGGPLIDSGVGFDHVAVGQAQGEHLVRQGYRHLAFVGSLRDNDRRAHKRLSGVEQAAAEAGLPGVVRMTAAQPGDPDLGDHLAGQLMERHPEVDAIVCNSDAVAFGVVRAFRKAGRSVPREIGIMGFGDSEASSCLSPSLTTIRPDRQAIGRLTAETIYARINGAGPDTKIVHWELMERETTARHRG